MTIHPNDLGQILTHLSTFGSVVPQTDLDMTARVIFTLMTQEKPEIVDNAIEVATQASAVIGFLENRWRGLAKRKEIMLESARAQVAKNFREASKTAGAKVTEAQVDQTLAQDENLVTANIEFSIYTEIADIMESLRYAIKNRFDGLLELSRNERITARTGG